ncbi:MAG TPA: response regulator transcription factor [Candidatus Coproplasma stercoripullorum]|uniref:Stage 0 sporulation protein A homolog n=1 Tax=Candidatus Coproplasma stercoripullorum TaxID=2840751 RepID=A0A9D1AIZ0_9FIRM|nr:response regulator transcription factor [Candidatus Coproplasma stercoripullorum]
MRLLLAEDEKSLSRALVAILQYNHYSVDAVYDGEEALNFLLNGNYDGAILDIMMPKKDGITVLEEFRKINKTMPVLLLTAKNEVEDRVKGLDSGADDYLGKPFDTKELLARIRAMLRRRGERSEDILTAADISLNRITFEISSPKGSIRLGNKEFQMLEMLMQSIGRVVSTEQFIEKIWGYDSEAEVNVVWTYLSFIRKKLAALSDRVSIRAIRNLGYILEYDNVQ